MTALSDWTHSATDIGERPLARTREATEDERIELARELDIPSCESLRVAYEVQPRPKGRFIFSGKLEADVTQACVVTLEPVPSHISETFSIELAPPGDIVEAPSESDIEVSSLPDVEPIPDGVIDAGALIFATLSAALDPYPRKSDADFDWVDPKAKDDPAAQSPFAALAKLKPKP